MGQDNLLPKIFTHLHPRYQTPYISIIACASIVSLLDPSAPGRSDRHGYLSLYGRCVMSLPRYSVYERKLQEIKAFPDSPGKKGLLLLFLAPTLIFVVALIDQLQVPMKMYRLLHMQYSLSIRANGLVFCKTEEA
jgi:amino acid transporter